LYQCEFLQEIKFFYCEFHIGIFNLSNLFR
jgi:hypothetical protein